MANPFTDLKFTFLQTTAHHPSSHNHLDPTLREREQSKRQLPVFIRLMIMCVWKLSFPLVLVVCPEQKLIRLTLK